MKFILPFCFALFFVPTFAISFVGEDISGDTITPSDGLLDVISLHPDVFLSPLAPEVNENSGLIFWRNMIWTHNDSGGEPAIYAIDTASGKILQTITLTGASNVDWEDITHDEAFIYVGDVGNNRGTRKDLKIYKIPKNRIPEKGDANISQFSEISFSYADQANFEKRMNRHNFDCEAITAIGDSIYLFTKNWGNQWTSVYALPKVGGNYIIKPKTDFNIGGLVTAAAVSPSGNLMAVLGYVDFESFLWIFWDFDDTNFFGGKMLRVNFPDLVFVQTEGICFISEADILFSCEESSEPPMLFTVNTSLFKDVAESRLGSYFSNEIQLSGMPPVVSGRIKLDILDLPEPEFYFELRNKRWEKLFEGSGVQKHNRQKLRISIKTKDLDNGLYFLKITSGEHSQIRKVRIKH